jgi:hypothetical protein
MDHLGSHPRSPAVPPNHELYHSRKKLTVNSERELLVKIAQCFVGLSERTLIAHERDVVRLLLTGNLLRIDPNKNFQLVEGTHEEEQ